MNSSSRALNWTRFKVCLAKIGLAVVLAASLGACSSTPRGEKEVGARWWGRRSAAYWARR